MSHPNDKADGRRGRARRQRAPASDFRKLIMDQAPLEDELPCIHTTDGLGFRSIIREGHISTDQCPVFNEPLLYLFYGRPSYRVNSQILATAIRAYAPVCFILKPGIITSPHRVFPFDSGAFHNDLFRDSMHRKMQRDDFALEPDPASPQRLIRLFFGDNDRYYRNQPIAELQLPPLAFEASSYHALINDRQENSYDERISSVELQIAEELPLGGAVEAVVLPDAFIVPEVIASLDAISAKAIPYSFIDRLRPESYASSIYTVVRDYYLRRGYL